IFRRDDELLDVISGTTAAGDERDVQLVVQIPAAQQRWRACDDPCGRQCPTDELTTRHSTLARLPRGLVLHTSSCVTAEIGSVTPIAIEVSSVPLRRTDLPPREPTT